jgi:hypothetical protein
MKNKNLERIAITPVQNNADSATVWRVGKHPFLEPVAHDSVIAMGKAPSAAGE